MMSSSAPAAAAEHNEADTMFAQVMIPHHEQAVEMSDMMLTEAGHPRLGDRPGHPDQGRPGPRDRDR